MFQKSIQGIASCGLIALTSLISTNAFASNDFANLKSLSQAEFNKLANDLTSVTSYKGVTPATPLGITGFDIGGEMSITNISNTSIWRKAGADFSNIIMPKLHVHKGLPFGIDLGASLSSATNSDIKLMGVEARYALLDGGVTLPAVGLRAAYSKLSGVSQLETNSKSIELLVSKGILNFTPYAGIGRVWSDVSSNVAGLQKVSPTASKVFAGLNANFGLVNVAGEVDRTGDNQTVSVKVGFRW